MTANKVIIHTDGACSGNPGPGGWGATLAYNGTRKELSGGEAETTEAHFGFGENLRLRPCQTQAWD